MVSYRLSSLALLAFADVAADPNQHPVPVGVVQRGTDELVGDPLAVFPQDVDLGPDVSRPESFREHVDEPLSILRRDELPGVHFGDLLVVVPRHLAEALVSALEVPLLVGHVEHVVDGV